eukprot:403334075
MLTQQNNKQLSNQMNKVQMINGNNESNNDQVLTYKSPGLRNPQKCPTPLTIQKQGVKTNQTPKYNRKLGYLQSSSEMNCLENINGTPQSNGIGTRISGGIINSANVTNFTQSNGVSQICHQNAPQHIRRFLSSIPNGIIIQNTNSALSSQNQGEGGKNHLTGIMINSAKQSIQDSNQLKQGKTQENNIVFSVHKNVGSLNDNRLNDIQLLLRKKHMKVRSKTSKLTRQKDEDQNERLELKLDVNDKSKQINLNLKSSPNHPNNKDQSLKQQSQIDSISQNRQIAMQRRSQKFQHIMEYNNSQVKQQNSEKMSFQSTETQLQWKGKNNDYGANSNIHSSNNRFVNKQDSFYNTQYQNTFSENNLPLQPNQSNNQFSSRAQSIKISDPLLTYPYQNSEDTSGIQLPNLNTKTSHTSKNQTSSQYYKQSTPKTSQQKKNKSQFQSTQKNSPHFQIKANGMNESILKNSSKQQRRKIKSILLEKQQTSQLSSKPSSDLTKFKHQTDKSLNHVVAANTTCKIKIYRRTITITKIKTQQVNPLNNISKVQPVTMINLARHNFYSNRTTIYKLVDEDLIQIDSPQKPYQNLNQQVQSMKFSPNKKGSVKQRILQIKPIQRSSFQIDDKTSVTPVLKPDKQYTQKVSDNNINDLEDLRSVLNIQKINVPQPTFQNNSNSLSPTKLQKNQFLNSPQIGGKKSLLSRTPEKCGITKRLVFRRRDRMKDRNLIIVYYDGVLGDTNYSPSFNNLRIRYGAISGLRKLYAWSQIVIVMPYITKRAKVIATYLEKHQGCPVDAIYTMRQKQLGKTKNKWFRYQQIFEDFDVNDEEKIISNVMIIGACVKEVYDKTEFDKDFKSDTDNSFGVEPSLKISNVPSILLEGCSGLTAKQDQNQSASNKVNPVSLIIPHLKLDTNNCNFTQVTRFIEAIKTFHLSQIKMLSDHSYDQGKRKDSNHTHLSANNRSMQSTSIEYSDFHGKKQLKSKKLNEFVKLNFLELFYQIQEQKQQKPLPNKDFQNVLTIENKELQAHIFKHEVIEEFLKDKTDKKKFSIVQKRFKALTDIENPQPATFDEMHPQISQMFSYQSMFSANESLNNNYILNYRKRYLGAAMNCTADEVMNAKQLNDLQMTQKTEWSEIPCSNLNYFATHRFFVLKGYLTCSKQQLIANTTNSNNCGSMNMYEYVDVQREMGEFLPNDIQNIINNQSQFDVQDWLCKKMFARPMNQIISKKKGAGNGLNQ